jgi:hypothetical protein
MANGPTENTQTQKSNFFADLPSNILGLPIDLISEGLNIFRPQERDFRTQFSPENTINPVLGSQNIKNLLGGTSDVILGATDAGLKGAGFYGLPTSEAPVQGNVMDATITDEERDLFNQGFKAIQAQEERDRMIENSPLSQMTQVLGNLKDQGVSADQRAEIAGRMLAPFLRQGADETRTSAFEQASREREARLAQEEAGRRESEARSRGISGEGLGGFMELARQAGAKGGAVKTMAQQLKADSDRQVGVLSQLEPTQLTYLLGELGYDITPKKAETTTPATTTPTTPTAPVVAEVQEFDTREEADASGLPIGTRVKIGGRDAVIT